MFADEPRSAVSLRIVSNPTRRERLNWLTTDNVWFELSRAFKSDSQLVSLLAANRVGLSYPTNLPSNTLKMVLLVLLRTRLALSVCLFGFLMEKSFNKWSPGSNSCHCYSDGDSSDVIYQLFMQNAATGVMKRSGMQVNLQAPDRVQPVLMVRQHASGIFFK